MPFLVSSGFIFTVITISNHSIPELAPSIRSIKHFAYMPNLVGIFVSSTYLAITWEVCIAVSCVLEHGCKNIRSMYAVNILVM